MMLFVLACAVAVADGPRAAEPPAAEAPAAGAPEEAPAWPAPIELEALEMPTSVEDALGIEGASTLRKIALGSLVTGGMLGVVGVTALSFGLDRERELLASAHPRDQVDALLLQRGAAAAVAWPSLVLGAVGLGAGVALLVFDDAGGGLSDGHEEVLP